MIELQHCTAGRKGFTAHSEDYLRHRRPQPGRHGNSTAYTSSVDGTVVSAPLTYDSPTTRIFAHSGMDASMRKLRPNQPLIAQALLDAAEQGLAIGDLFGIAPLSDPTHLVDRVQRVQTPRRCGRGPGRHVDVSVSPRYTAYRAARRARDEPALRARAPGRRLAVSVPGWPAGCMRRRGTPSGA